MELISADVYEERNQHGRWTVTLRIDCPAENPTEALTAVADVMAAAIEEER